MWIIECLEFLLIMDRWMEVQIERQTDGQMDGQMDRWMIHFQ